MNILTENLPQSVEVGGKTYKINTDFRAGIKFELMIQKSEGTIGEVLTLFYEKNLPYENIDEAIKAIELFYCCGELPDKEKKEDTPKTNAIPYAFDEDASAIFADFWNFYNIDLSNEGLHWWVFRSLLEGLPEKSEFKQRLYYRTVDVKNLSKSEKKRVLKIRSMIEIKPSSGEKTTLEGRNKKMLDYVAKRMAEASGGVKQ